MESWWRYCLGSCHLDDGEGDGKITLRWILGKSLYWWKVDRTDSALCLLTGFDDICLNLQVTIQRRLVLRD
jgi:hypothetical protein